MKRKPADELGLIEHTRSVIRTPKFLSWLHSHGVKIQQTHAPVKGEWVSTADGRNASRIVYYLHGGGYVSGSPETYRPITASLARRLKARVFVLDYRLAPEHRFPAAFDDAVAGYRWLASSVSDTRQISVAGDSAGGGLALALLMKLRDSGDSLPVSVACLSPWTDLVGAGASNKANDRSDPLLFAEDVGRYAAAYLGTHSPRDPLASPLYGDFHGLPPLLIHVGKSEVLLDDARSTHAKAIDAGVASTLRVFDAVPHVWQLITPFLPEARRSCNEIAEFISKNWRNSESAEYPDSMTLAEARASFFQRSGLGADGGYGARWVRVEARPVPFYFPNTRGRVKAAKLHDLHHVATEYATDWPGEAEIAGWEIAGGCGRHTWAWMLNLGAFAVGMVLFPKRLFAAFLRGRRSNNLYREDFPEARLGDFSVGWLRSRIGSGGNVPQTNARDRIAFGFWCLVAFLWHAIGPAIGLFIVLKMVGLL